MTPTSCVSTLSLKLTDELQSKFYSLKFALSELNDAIVLEYALNTALESLKESQQATPRSAGRQDVIEIDDEVSPPRPRDATNSRVLQRDGPQAYSRLDGPISSGVPVITSQDAGMTSQRSAQSVTSAPTWISAAAIAGYSKSLAPRPRYPDTPPALSSRASYYEAATTAPSRSQYHDSPASLPSRPRYPDVATSFAGRPQYPDGFTSPLISPAGANSFDPNDVGVRHIAEPYPAETSQAARRLALAPKYHCDHCTAVFFSRQRLEKHMVVHMTGSLSYQCHLCFKSFNCKSNVKAHLRLHTGEKPFPCKICGKCFRMKHHLKRHSQLHEALKQDFASASVKAELLPPEVQEELTPLPVQDLMSSVQEGLTSPVQRVISSPVQRVITSPVQELMESPEHVATSPPPAVHHDEASQESGPHPPMEHSDQPLPSGESKDEAEYSELQQHQESQQHQELQQHNEYKDAYMTLQQQQAEYAALQQQQHNGFAGLQPHTTESQPHGGYMTLHQPQLGYSALSQQQMQQQAEYNAQQQQSAYTESPLPLSYIHPLPINELSFNS